MENVEPRTLEAMQRYRTRYEVAVEINGETTVVGYMTKKSRATLVAVARFWSDEILTALGDDADKPWTYSKVVGLKFSEKVRVYFTGRTEREARIELNGR